MNINGIKKLMNTPVETLQKWDKLNARAYADRCHSLENQMYDGKPYVEGHLDNVARFFLLFFGSDPVILASIYCHDVLEDTKLGKKTLSKEMGAVIHNIVWNVTDGEGQTREERQLRTYVRTRSDSSALLVKLCDRGTNMLFSKGTKYSKMYVDEYPRFKGALYTGWDAYEEIWGVLDNIVDELKKDLESSV